MTAQEIANGIASRSRFGINRLDSCASTTYGYIPNTGARFAAIRLVDDSMFAEDGSVSAVVVVANGADLKDLAQINISHRIEDVIDEMETARIRLAHGLPAMP